MSSDSEDDHDLLMAAGEWAADEPNSDDEGETSAVPAPEETASNWDYVKKNKKDKKKSVKPEQPKVEATPQSTTDRKNFSLHLTKVPFDATQTTIRYAFTEKNCNVTSVRLVYDTDPKTRERTFRGVAFVDFADETSFNAGLKLHNTAFLGGKRKVNVRPTKTRSELSEIVKKTEERVAMLIARSKEKKRAREEERGAKDEGGDVSAKKKQKRDKKNKKKDKSADGKKSNELHRAKSAKDGDGNTKKSPNKIAPEKKAADSGKKAKRGKSKSPKKESGNNKSDDASTKLTKKQRAQKAAIIRSKKRK